jgi:hypothetical protein
MKCYMQFHFEEAILKMLKITLSRPIKLTFNLMLFLSTQRTINTENLHIR